MNSLLKRGSSLSILLLFLIPFLANAQADFSISEESTFSMDTFINENSEDLQKKIGNSGDLAEMPIHNPESNTAVKIYRPPKDLVYNMPIIGNQDTSQLNIGFKEMPKSLSGDKNQSSN